MEKIKTKNKSVTLQEDVVAFIESLRVESGLSFSTQLNLLVKKMIKK